MAPSEYALTTVMKDTEGKYELVVIHPSHFLIDNFPLVIKHPLTKQFKPFYANERGDGTLREGSPTGPILPPFYSRGKIHREIPLNPILVNWAAMIRFRRLIRQNPMWGSALHPSAVRVLRGVVELHAAVLWDPPRSCSRQFIINPAGSNLSYDLQAWPYFLTSPWSNLGIKTNIPSTALERAFEMLEEGRVLLFVGLCSTLIGFLPFVKVLKNFLTWMVMTPIIILTFPWN